MLPSGRVKGSAFLHSAHTGGRSAVRHTPQRQRLASLRLASPGWSSPKASKRRWRTCLGVGCSLSLGWGLSRRAFEDCGLRCRRSFWWVCSGSGSSTARKPRWTCSPWAPDCPWSGSSSAAAWTAPVSSSTAACASSTAGSRRAPSTRTSWRSSSSPRTRIRNTGRTFCRRCRGLPYLSKTDTKR